MYLLTDAQIEFIRRDLLAQGIQLEGLQQDLLDHICCVVEHELAAEDDFEAFYQQRIKHFYKRELREIEEETIALLTFKNYYIMKKIMLLSGGVLTALLVVGLTLKFMHLPGAAVMLVLGVAILNFVFLPLLFTLKIKEKQTSREKAISGIATICGMLMSIGLIFKVMHWPGANMLIVVGFGALLLVFLPVYFFTGIRQAETKVNTIVSSVIILSAASLILILVRSPKATEDVYAATTASVLRSEQILKNQQLQIQKLSINDTAEITGNEVYDLCQNIKKYLIRCETGGAELDIAQGKYITEGSAEDYFAQATPAANDLAKVNDAISKYNRSLGTSSAKIEDLTGIQKQRVADAIQRLIQTQMMVLQNHALQQKVQ
ncbi:MAG: hypothetical protein JST78_12900 [Bacteroidetes bacterium]|nr:hypothetical protein [Bacteroidota bacterium]